jgi:hypothetical protein
MLEAGARVPDALVWIDLRGEAVQLRDALAGDGLALLCFYVFDWSPG